MKKDICVDTCVVLFLQHDLVSFALKKLNNPTYTALFDKTYFHKVKNLYENEQAIMDVKNYLSNPQNLKKYVSEKSKEIFTDMEDLVGILEHCSTIIKDPHIVSILTKEPVKQNPNVTKSPAKEVKKHLDEQGVLRIKSFEKLMKMINDITEVDSKELAKVMRQATRDADLFLDVVKTKANVLQTSQKNQLQELRDWLDDLKNSVTSICRNTLYCDIICKNNNFLIPTIVQMELKHEKHHTLDCVMQLFDTKTIKKLAEETPDYMQTVFELAEIYRGDFSGLTDEDAIQMEEKTFSGMLSPMKNDKNSQGFYGDSGIVAESAMAGYPVVSFNDQDFVGIYPGHTAIQDYLYEATDVVGYCAETMTAVDYAEQSDVVSHYKIGKQAIKSDRSFGDGEE